MNPSPLPNPDFTIVSLCQFLTVSRSWVYHHAKKYFKFYSVDGRGCTGKSPRYTYESVVRWRAEHIAAENNHETISEAAQRINREVGAA